MKILVFSDTHLTKKFNKHKFNFLKEIITNADRVIINGDFWEGDLVEFDAFIKSKWSKLFPLLRERKTVYIYGNHDAKDQSDSRVALFSTKQTNRYALKIHDTTYVFEHGDLRCDFIRDTRARFLARLNIDVFVFNALLHFFTNVTPHPYFFQKAFGKFNKEIKENIQRKEGEIYIFSHTHCAEFELGNKFINTGIIRYGLGQYITIEDGIPIPHEEYYYPHFKPFEKTLKRK